MKKFILLCLLLLAGWQLADASSLYRVRFASYPEKIRAVFDFNGAFSYAVKEATQEKIILLLKNCSATADISNYVEANDLIVRYFEIEKQGADLLVSIPLGEPIDYQLFYLSDPPRLVIDFGRDFIKMVSGGMIADGIEFLKVKKGSADGSFSASVLKIDPRKTEIEPALAQKQKPNLFESFINFILPWKKEENRRHFFIDKVSAIVKDNGGVAGVNGTFFAYNGKPLGALMIAREMVSFSINDRTALFFDEENQPYIDNVYISSYARLSNGVSLPIKGMNENRDNDEIIIYTPAWGEHTETDNSGIELVVSKSVVTQINIGNSSIPEDGYVISINGPEVEQIGDFVKVGEKLDVHIKVVPFSSSPKTIVHLISGGPRLLKTGVFYVTKYGEKFRSDVANSRVARTAVGIDRQNQLLLVTVDGNHRKNGKAANEEASIGATLEELSNLMLSLGAVDAMNLDGGSSSTMVVKDKVVNHPSSGSQRRVSNALLVRPKI